MSFFPIYLEMRGRRCLVIGGGSVAERKIAHLLEAGAEVTVISPDASENVARWSKNNSIQLEARCYENGDLDGYELAFVATDDDRVNASVYQEGKSRGVWVNAADDPSHCDFILPSVLRRGDLTVAVSSGGQSPALARTIREELEIYFSREYEQLAQLAAETRAELHRRALHVPFETWRRALSGDVRQFLMRGEIARAKSHLLKELGVSL
ncbi:MAG: bifunctional precorrin-2 dehydrogenase/sirohydrochlorin ferrochelatase [Candidatus Binatia bacterium]